MKSLNNKSFWDKCAKVYTKFVYKGKYEKQAYDKMITGVQEQLETNMKVLELAAGPGVLSIGIAPFCKELIATDFSQEMIKEAKKKKIGGNITYQIADATKLAYKDGEFDAVVIANALHIMPNPDLALRNIRRVLKKDGLLIAPTFVRENIKSKCKEKLMELLGFRTYSRWTYVTYKDYLQKQGFQILNAKEIYGHNFPIAFIVAVPI